MKSLYIVFVTLIMVGCSSVNLNDKSIYKSDTLALNTISINDNNLGMVQEPAENIKNNDVMVYPVDESFSPLTANADSLMVETYRKEDENVDGFIDEVVDTLLAPTSGDGEEVH